MFVDGTGRQSPAELATSASSEARTDEHQRFAHDAQQPSHTQSRISQSLINDVEDKLAHRQRAWAVIIQAIIRESSLHRAADGIIIVNYTCSPPLPYPSSGSKALNTLLDRAIEAND